MHNKYSINLRMRKYSLLWVLIILLTCLVMSVIGIIIISVWHLFHDPDCVDVTVTGLNADARTVILIVETDKNKVITLPWCRKKVFPFTIHPNQYQQNVDLTTPIPNCHEYVKWTEKEVKRYGLLIYNSKDEASLYWFKPGYVSFYYDSDWLKSIRGITIDVKDGEPSELPADFIP